MGDFFSKYSQINWALADQVLVSGVNFLTGLLLARFLGLSEFGVFTLLWMAVLFLNSIQLAAIISPMMSIGPKQESDQAEIYYGALLLQQLVFSLITFVVLYLGVSAFATFTPGSAIEKFALPLACAGLFFQLQDFMRRYYFCKNMALSAFKNDSVSYGGQLIILVCVFYLDGLDNARALWIISITSLIAVAISFIKVEWSKVQLADFIPAIRKNWKISKWLSASALLQWTSGNLFILSAGAVLGASAVGALKAAQNIIGVSHILFQALENIVPIRASENYSSKGATGLSNYLKKVFFVSGSILVGICVVVSFFAEFLMSIVYGESFASYGYLLTWYAAIYMVIFVCLLLRSGLRAFENTRPIFVAYIFMTVFSFAFAKPMVEALGLNGAMLGIFLSQLIMAISLSVSLWNNVRDFHEGWLSEYSSCGKR